MTNNKWKRRDFLRLSAQATGALGLGQSAELVGAQPQTSDTTPNTGASLESTRPFNRIYEGERLNQIAFPMGGMGAGMICLEGTGALSKFSLRNRPDLATQYKVFAAISIKGSRPTARVLEGPVPRWKLRPEAPGPGTQGLPSACWGLPRFHRASFEARFPFATVRLEDDQVPLKVELVGWSPFSPGDADNASLPVAGLEYRLSNHSPSPVDAVFSFNAENVLAERQNLFAPDAKSLDRIGAIGGGFVLYGPGAKDEPWNEGYLAAWVDDPSVKVNHAWLRTSPVHLDQMVWNDISSEACYTQAPLSDSPSPGASLFVPLALAPGESKTLTLRLAWYVPRSAVFAPGYIFKDDKVTTVTEAPAGTYQPWYAGRFSSIHEVIAYWQEHYRSLRRETEQFTRAFYDSTLPPETLEAIAANLSILKSPTVLRQTDGRLWGWEGCYDTSGGGGYGSSTHVWNYAQAVPHLFPTLERSLRETEFGESQDARGHQSCRASLPIRPLEKETVFPPSMHDAADGQLGGILKFYRDWRISGDTGWLRRWWPRIRASLDYCIETWDPEHRGWIEEAHLTTYDGRLWGPDSLCTSLYVGALKAATLMGEALNDNVRSYSELLRKAVTRMEGELFNGEFFIQKIEWKALRNPFPRGNDAWERAKTDLFESAESLKLLQEHGPHGQYGPGCLSDGVFGAWLSWVCGVGEVLDRPKIKSHLSAVHRHNLKADLTDHANVCRSAYANGEEAGLVLCTWPRGGRPPMPMAYVDEVWTAIEYQVASHLISLGNTRDGLEIVRATRRRYDGRVRNPFAEMEAGQWYARAMSSYALLQAFSGARYDAVDQILHLKPAIKGDFRCFLSTATGYGTVGVKNGQPFVEVVSGEIPYRQIKYTAA